MDEVDIDMAAKQILISPSETRSGLPKRLEDLGFEVTLTTSIEDEYGADCVAETIAGTLAIQRKAIADLIASLTASGILGAEISKLRFADIPWLVVEGNWEETIHTLEIRSFSVAALRKLLTSIRREGVWVDYTTCVGDTAIWVVNQIEYWNEARHDSLLTRPRVPVSVRAADQQRERALEVLMSWQGIGRKRAEAILDNIGFPLAWTCTPEELAAVPLMGETTARRVMQYGK